MKGIVLRSSGEWQPAEEILILLDSGDRFNTSSIFTSLQMNFPFYFATVCQPFEHEKSVNKMSNFTQNWKNFASSINLILCNFQKWSHEEESLKDVLA